MSTRAAQLSRGRFQVSDSKELAEATGMEPAHGQRRGRMSWPHNGSDWSDGSDVGGKAHPRNGAGWTCGKKKAEKVGIRGEHRAMAARGKAGSMKGARHTTGKRTTGAVRP